jgi:hypothetical protein
MQHGRPVHQPVFQARPGFMQWPRMQAPQFQQYAPQRYWHPTQSQQHLIAHQPPQQEQQAFQQPEGQAQQHYGQQAMPPPNAPAETATEPRGLGRRTRLPGSGPRRGP